MKAAAVVALVANLAGSAAAAAQDAPSRRIAQLAEWLDAVRSHEPGDSDAALFTLARWNNVDIREVWLDVQTLLHFVHCTDCRAPTVHGIDGRARSIPYTKNDIIALREMSATLREPPGAENDLLKRAAILHADVVMLAQPERRVYVEQPHPNSSRSAAPPGPDRIILQTRDGRQERLVDDAAHFDISYVLLDHVTNGADKGASQHDETVRLWYLATTAYVQSHALHDLAHVERALHRFPNDADIQFQAGCLHESLASARVQTVVRTAKVPSGVVVTVKSERAELEIAERYFRRTLELAPSFQEARLRLGRVLGLLDRHDQAAAELRQVSDDVDHLALRYFTALFLGREEELLGRRDAARAAYEKASGIFPLAQSPQIALSHLARESGNRDEALAHLQRVLALPPNEIDRRDPFWIYHFIEGRHLDEWLDRLYQPFRRKPRADGR